MTTDTLADLLQGIRLSGALFFEIRAHAPWASASAEASRIAPQLLPGAQHMISFHVVAEGRCWATLAGTAPLLLEAGDIVVFPHGDPHVLASDPQLTAKPRPESYKAAAKATSLPLSFTLEGPGAPTQIICGFLGCDLVPFNPLIATLPHVLHIRDRVGSTRGWLNQFVQLALAESRDRRPGAQSILARLSELMFVEAVRRHLEALPAGDTGWLAGLRDEAVGRALAALHRQPAHAWSLEDLAREAGTSRSVLADRFAQLVGRPPMQYLAQWRMQLAAGLLARGAKVSAVAPEVGYESEAAFSRAFKKLTGQAPGTWRDRHGLGAVRPRPQRGAPRRRVHGPVTVQRRR